MLRLVLKTLVEGSLVTLLTLPASAATIQVAEEDGTFYLSLTFKSELLPEALFARLTDYQNLNLINPMIEASRIVGKANGNQKIVWKKLRGCITFFCRELEHTEFVTEEGNKITMMTIPERSDFELGQSHWKVMPGATGSRVRFASALKPSFSLPPLLGNWLMKQKIQDELYTTAGLLGDLDSTQ